MIGIFTEGDTKMSCRETSPLERGSVPCLGRLGGFIQSRGRSEVTSVEYLLKRPRGSRPESAGQYRNITLGKKRKSEKYPNPCSVQEVERKEHVGEGVRDLHSTVFLCRGPV